MEEKNNSPIELKNNISSNYMIDKEEKEIAKVSFYSDEETLLFEGQYTFSTPISEVIKDFIQKHEEKKNFFSFYQRNIYSEKYLLNENKLISSYITNLQDTIGLMEIGLVNNSAITTTISSNKFLKLYVKKNQNINFVKKTEEYIINNTKCIGKPAINQMKYYVYNKDIKKLNTVNLNKAQIEEIQIDFFSRKTSYCNALNYLFIYEGNDNNINKNPYINIDYLNNDIFNNNGSKFISINLIKNEVILLSQKFPQRILHSMIFIPDKYIFVVGGKSTKTVLIYTINKDNKIYETYPHYLPYELLEPSLITVDNKYLYSIDNSTFIMRIIRNNFVSLSPFEEIKLESNIKIEQKFFGLIKQNNDILFLGGQFLNSSNNISKNNYKFNCELNKIIQAQKEYIDLDIYEKTFIPLGDNDYIQITEKSIHNTYIPQIIIFQGNLKKSHKTNILSSNATQNKYHVSIHSKNVNIRIHDNLTSLVGASSYGEMPVPLYNNLKYK